MDGENTESVLQVDFRIYGVDPKHLDSLLGAIATMSRRKGDGRELPSGKMVYAKTTVWRLKSPICSNDLNDHIEFFINKLDLRTKGEEIGRIADVVMLDVFFAKADGYIGPMAMEFRISSHNIRYMALCRMELSITI